MNRQNFMVSALILVACMLTQTAEVCAKKNLLLVKFSQPNPHATKQQLLDRVLPEQYHGVFMGQQKWSANELQEFPFDLAAETYHVYLPEGYSEEQSYGLFVWIDPSDFGQPKKAWLEVFDDLGFIFVAANNSGNQHSVTARRIPLALHALHNMPLNYSIDPNRTYVAGFSGGGYTASRLAVGYGDLVAGAFYTSGAEILGGKWVDLPPPNVWQKVKNQNRYVFYAGTKEWEYLTDIKAAFASYEVNGVENIHFFNKANRGHTLIDSRLLRKGLILLDNGESE